MNRSLPELPSAQWDELELHLEAFESAWRRGECPAIEDHLPTEPYPTFPCLIELVHLDLEYRLTSGEPARVEVYLARFPQLAENRAAVVELIAAEYELRRRRLPQLTREDYVARFPDYREELIRQFSKSSDAAAGPRPTPREPTVALAGPTPPPPVLDRLLETLVYSELTRPDPVDALPHVPGYELLGELGRGGMGVVYKAVHCKLKRVVALKMILAGGHAGRDMVARFRQEAEVIARLQHPHIVQIFEIGEDEDKPYFALEFVDGGSLSRFSGTPQSPAQACATVSVLARAMHAAHQAGIIHRDLKPGNVLLATRSDQARAPAVHANNLPLSAYEPKITDFGLAKQLDAAQELSRSGEVMGTPTFMAPEQAAGRLRDIGPRTDVYALSAMLYDLLTGRPPFKGSTVMETLEMVRTQEPVPPSRLQPKLPRDLETICLKGLRKDVRQRYGSALELADDLGRFLDGQPILARPVPAWERAWKWARREPARAAAIGASVLALAGMVVGTLFYSLYREHQAAAKTQKLERQREARQRFDNQLGLAEGAEETNRLDDAGDHFEQALALLDDDPEAVGTELRPRVEAGRARVRSKAAAEKERVQRDLTEQTQRREVLDQRAKFAQRVEQFNRARDQVLFHSVSLREENGANDAAVVRRAAPAALELLGLDVTQRPDDFGKGMSGFRPILESSAPLDRVAADVLTVLLTWAAAELASTTDAADSEPNPRRALRLLEAAQSLATAHALRMPQVYHVRRAACHQLLGQDAEAAADRRNAAAAPRLSIDEVELARSYLRGSDLRRLDLAEAACEQVDAADPYRFWAQYLAALCNLLRKEPQWNVALSRLGNCLEKRPNDATLLMHRAIAYAGAGQLPKAEADFREALARSTDPIARVVVLTNRSFVWVQLGRWQEAENDLADAIARQPEAYQGHANLAYVYQQQHKRAEAIREIDEAVRCRPSYAALYFVRARMQLDRDDLKAARLDFEEFLKREPSESQRRPIALLGLARVKLKTGDPTAALADCDAVLQQRPNFGAAHLQRADVLRRLNRLDEAGQALDRYLTTGGTVTAEIHKVRGLIQTSQGRHSEATDAFTRALLLHEDAETHSLRGWAFLAQEASRPALADFDAALRLEKAHAEAQCGRAWSLALLGKTSEAIVAAEDVLKQQPQSRTLLFKLACVYGLALRQPGPLFGPAFCRERAVTLLHQALRGSGTEAESRTFWQLVVEKAPEFNALRGSGEWRELGRLYGSRK